MFTHSDLARGNRGEVILTVLLALIGSNRLPAEAQNTIVTGVVKNVSGEPVAGALVKVRNGELGLGFMVVSQTQGQYSTPNLLPGKYMVQGFGGGFQSEPVGPVEASRGQQGKRDLVLSTPRRIAPPVKRLTEADYTKLMPEGEGKRLITTRCVLCHGTDRIVRIRRIPEGWQKTVELMRFYLQANGVPLSDHEKNTVLDYVVKNFGPDTPPLRLEGNSSDPNGHLPRTLLKGPDAMFMAMEFDLPTGAWVHDIAIDSQGGAWVAENSVGGMLGCFDANSLTYARIAPPPGKVPERSFVTLAIDPQDDVWFTDGRPNGLLMRYNPKNKEFNTYDIPTFPNTRGPTIEALRFLDGNVWGTGITLCRIMKFELRTGKWTDYPVPVGSLPYGLAISRDGMIWYAGSYANEVGKLNPHTGQLTRYTIPTPKSYPKRMQADAESNLWVGGLESGKLVKVDYRTGKVTEYDSRTAGSGPYSMDVDRQRNLIWFSEYYTGKLGRYDPRTNRLVEFSLPSADLGPGFSDAKVAWIHVDSTSPNRVWWATGTTAKIGYIEVIE